MRRKRSAGRAHALPAGLTAGVLLGLVWFSLEVLRDRGGATDFLGSPLTTIAAVYAGLGAGVGLVLGIGAAATARALRLHAGVLAVCATGFALSVFYLLRDASAAGLRANAWSAAWPVLVAFGGWALVALAEGRRRRPGPSARTWVLSLLSLFVVAALIGYAPWSDSRLGADRDPAPGSPNLVLVCVDALRPDHLGAYGYDRDTSPTVDVLAREGVRFANAYSHGNRTIIAVPSLMTGLYPSTHGATSVGERITPLAQTYKTLAEYLQDGGYTTVGMMSNVFLKRAFGLAQGFDRTEEFNTTRFRLSAYRVLIELGLLEPSAHKASVAPDARRVTDEAIEWIDRVGQRPFFLYVHYMDVHHPYTPPGDYATRYGRPLPGESDDELFMRTVELLDSYPVALDSAGVARLRDLYDGCIRYTDDQFSRLMQRLRALDGNRETIVVFTSDHGDEFLEKGSLYHNNLVIEELIRVPLIVWSSGRREEGRVVDALARHVDVLPTMLDLAGLPAEPDVDGTSLNGLMEGTAEVAGSESIAEGDFCTAIITDGYKMMYVDSTSTFELYSLQRGGVRLNPAQWPIANQLQARLEEYLRSAAERRRSAAVDADAEAVRQLKALGYL